MGVESQKSDFVVVEEIGLVLTCNFKILHSVKF